MITTINATTINAIPGVLVGNTILKHTGLLLDNSGNLVHTNLKN